MKRVQSHLKIGASAAAIVATFAAFSPAFSGGFAVREQSTTYQGMSFAGAASGDYLSSMFWNSAAAAAAPGMNSESHAALAILQSDVTATGGAFAGLGTESGDIAQDAIIPSSYFNYQLNEKLFFGLAMTSPFGLTTKPQNTDWAGSPFAVTSKVFTLNVNPNLAYKITPELTVGAGIQVQYNKLRLNSGGFANAAVTNFTFTGREVEGDGFSYGGTAGVIWEPTQYTNIGLGYRSSMDVEIDGTCKGSSISTVLAGNGFTPGGPADPCNGSIETGLTLPDLVTLSLSHQASDRLKLLGTVEWTNWSRATTAKFINNAGDQVDVFPLEYEDGWFYSVGAEYKVSPALTVRGGLAYEETPIPDAELRSSLADGDRIWLSLGGSYKYSEKLTFDLAYTHIFVDDRSICETETGPAAGCAFLEAESESSADIISVAARYKFNAGDGYLEPLK